MNSLTDKQIYDLNNMNVAAQNIELGNVVNTLIVEGGGDGGNSGGGSGGNEEKNSGKRTCRFTIGTSTSGWTEGDCDYLCDGVDDQIEINKALTDLPTNGGKIIILDGTYNITSPITIAKNSTTLSGNGNSTVLKRMWNSAVTEGIINLSSKNECAIQSLYLNGNKSNFANSNNAGIYLNNSSNNTVTGNTCNNNTYGIYLNLSSSNNTVTGNTCNNNSYYSIYLYSSSDNTITGNTCNNNNKYGISLYSSSNNIISGNTCNNSKDYGINLSTSCNNNTIVGNTCNNNSVGINLYGTNRNTIVANTCIRGTGTPDDYTSSQYTIRLSVTINNYNLIAYNNIMGKNYTSGGGTGNTFTGNKYN